ncbi:MAG: NUDIX hydrolase [Oscillospiraceae bacterium]|nr:NUDIX hydrolase [Oscillospiraceae bacterium]
MKLAEKWISSDYKFYGKIINTRVDQCLLPDGNQAIREVVEHPGGVTVAALTDKDELFFVRQFRYPFMAETLELPAGKLERGEDPFEAMKREQREETGTWSEEYIFLGEVYPTPGYCAEILRLWACRVAGYTKMDLDEDEFLEVEKIPLEEAYQMALNNQLPDAKTQIGVLRTYALVKAGRL